MTMLKTLLSMFALSMLLTACGPGEAAADPQEIDVQIQADGGAPDGARESTEANTTDGTRGACPVVVPKLGQACPPAR